DFQKDRLESTVSRYTHALLQADTRITRACRREARRSGAVLVPHDGHTKRVENVRRRLDRNLGRRGTWSDVRTESGAVYCIVRRPTSARIEIGSPAAGAGGKGSGGHIGGLQANLRGAGRLAGELVGARVCCDSVARSSRRLAGRSTSHST